MTKPTLDEYLDLKMIPSDETYEYLEQVYNCSQLIKFEDPESTLHLMMMDYIDEYWDYIKEWYEEYLV